MRANTLHYSGKILERKIKENEKMLTCLPSKLRLPKHAGFLRVQIKQPGSNMDFICSRRSLTLFVKPS